MNDCVSLCCSCAAASPDELGSSSSESLEYDRSGCRSPLLVDYTYVHGVTQEQLQARGMFRMMTVPAMRWISPKLVARIMRNRSVRVRC